MVMMVFSTVAKKVFTPKTRAQSSLEREVAIWKLGKTGGLVNPWHPAGCWGGSGPQEHHAHGNGHQELVGATEEDVGSIAQPDVGGGVHEQEQSRLECCHHSNHQL